MLQRVVFPGLVISPASMRLQLSTFAPGVKVTQYPSQTKHAMRERKAKSRARRKEDIQVFAVKASRSRIEQALRERNRLGPDAKLRHKEIERVLGEVVDWWQAAGCE